MNCSKNSFLNHFITKYDYLNHKCALNLVELIIRSSVDVHKYLYKLIVTYFPMMLM